MAQSGKQRGGASKGNSMSGYHVMPSGLRHNSDSNAALPEGTFVDFFGDPGDPGAQNPKEFDRGLAGEQKNIFPRFLQGGRGSLGKAKR